MTTMWQAERLQRPPAFLPPMIEDRAELPDDWCGSSPRPWRHYLFRNLSNMGDQNEVPTQLRKPTPMRWGMPTQPGHLVLADTTGPTLVPPWMR